MRFRSALLASLFVVGGCGSFEPSCDAFPDECAFDPDCDDDEICVDGITNRECVPVVLCEDGCPANESCIQRPDTPPRNPFEPETPGKRVCTCDGQLCGDGGNGAWGGYGGSGAYGGEGGSGGSGGFGGSGGSTSLTMCGIESPSGEPQSSTRFGDAETQGGPLLALVDTGVDLFTMTAFPFAGTVDPGGGPVTSKGGTDIAFAIRSGDDALALAGGIGGTGAEMLTALDGSKDLFLLAISFEGTIDLPGETLDAGSGSAVALVGIDPLGAFASKNVLRSDGQVTVSGVAVDAFQQYVTVAGSFSGSLDLGDVTLTSGGGTDGFVARIDLYTDAVIWTHQLGGAGDQELSALTVTTGGDAIAAGSFDGITEIDGQSGDSDGRDGLVLRLDDTGSLISARFLGGPERQVVSALAPTLTDGVVLTGARSGPTTGGKLDLGEGFSLDGVGLVDTFVVHLGAESELQWAQLFSGWPEATEIVPRAIAVDCEDHVTITGSTTGGVLYGNDAAIPGIGKSDTFVMKLDRLGKKQWIQVLGGAEDDSPTSVVARGNKDILVGGSFFGAANFGAGELVSAGADDTFVARLSP